MTDTSTPNTGDAPVAAPDLDVSLDDMLAEGQTPTLPVVDPVSEPEVVTEPAAPVTRTALLTAPDSKHDSDEPPVVRATPENSLHQFATRAGNKTGAPDIVDLPPESEETIRAIMGDVPNINLTTSDAQLKWGESLTNSLSMLPMANMYTGALKRPGASFTQTVTHLGADLRGRAPTFKSKPGTQEVEGDYALLQLMTHIGVGGLFRAPLFNSGFWVTFKPAMNDEFIDINRLLYADEVQMGRFSYGLALSNSVVYTTDRLFEFALRHVYNTSVKQDELPLSKLRDYIVPQDINSFLWGFLCACYPSGFQYRTACINTPDKCNHVIEDTINLTKLQNNDSSMLTDWQKQHMTSMSANSKSLESIVRYQSESAATKKRRVVLNQGTAHEVAILLKTPTVTEYIDHGHRWIGGMVDNVTSVLGADASPAKRNELINQLSKATTLCQYAHWIEEVEFGELTVSSENPEAQSVKRVKDQASLENALKVLSAMDAVRDTIIDEVMKYINETTVSVIGIPAYDCPVCKKPQEGDELPKYPRHVSVIPLDVIQVFFVLLSQRLQRIMAQ